MLNNLRAISGRRVGGIGVPFRTKDAYKTWFDDRTNYHLTLFRQRPIFVTHMSRPELVGRGGTLDDASFRIMPEGLYLEGDLDDNYWGNYALDLIKADDGAWSTGAWPTKQTLRVRSSDGYVMDWAIVEGSICKRSEVASPVGTTLAEHIRAIYPQVESLERSFYMGGIGGFTRSLTVYEGENGAGGGSAIPAITTDQIGKLTAAVEKLTAKLDEVETPPTRSLPPGGDVPDNRNPQITVSSKYDGVSLFGMLLHDRAMQIKRGQNGAHHERSEEFMRAVVDKAAFLHKQSEGIRLSGVSNLRAIDDDAFEAWHEKVPYLRANEALQSTLATSGDELVPTMLNSTAYYAFMLETRVAQLLEQFQMPSNPFDYPTVLAGVGLRKVTEPADQASAVISASTIKTSKPASGKTTFLAGEVGTIVLASKILFEDAGLSMADVIATEAARRAASDIDWVILNGDERTAATNISHSADPTGTVYDKALILDGLRRIAQAVGATSQLDGAGAAITDAVGRNLSKKAGYRGKIGRDIENLVLFVDPQTAYNMDAFSTYQTIQNVGSDKAVTLKGQIGQLGGIPIVVADELEPALATGLYSAATHPPIAPAALSGQLVLVHRKIVKVGKMREVTVEQGPIPFTGMYALAITTRLDVQQFEAGGVTWGFNFI